INGKIYIAQPPLFCVKKGKSEQYMASEEQRDRFLLERAVDDTVVSYRERATNGANGGKGKKEPASQETPEVTVTKKELKTLLEDVIALCELSRVLSRKGVPLKDYLALRSDGGRLPRYQITLDGNVQYAYSESDLAKLIEASDAKSSSEA